MFSHDLCTSQTSWLLFRLFFQLFPIIRNIWPHLSSFTIYIYTVSGHSHTLDMAIHENSIRDSRLGRDVTSIVAALHASWHVARRSARGMCSMNTSSSEPSHGRKQKQQLPENALAVLKANLVNSVHFNSYNNSYCVDVLPEAGGGGH